MFQLRLCIWACLFLFSDATSIEPISLLGANFDNRFFEIFGKINISGIQAKTVVYEYTNKYTNEPTIEHVCGIPLSIGCSRAQNAGCFCKETSEPGILVIYLCKEPEVQYSGWNVSAVLYEIGDVKAKKIYSNSLRLPVVYDTKHDNLTVLLRVNDELVDIKKCLLKTKIRKLNVTIEFESKRNTSYDVFLIENNLQTRIPRNSYQMYYLNDSSDTITHNFTWQIRVGKIIVQLLNCSFQLEQNSISENTSLENDLTSLLLIALGTIFLMIAVVFMCTYIIRLIKQKRRANTSTRHRSDSDMELGKYKGTSAEDVEESKSLIADSPANSFPDNKDITRLWENSKILLLVGESGKGKSATGNTILQQKAFESFPRTSPVTKAIEVASGTLFGNLIKVVDGPGFSCDSLQDSQTLKDFKETYGQAFTVVEEGFDAILCVFRHGDRLFKKVNVFQAMKTLFGDDAIKKYCILVVTHVDNWEPNETKTDNLLDYYLEQEGVFKELYEACERRTLFIDNRTNEKEQIECQLKCLLDLLKRIESNGQTYNKDQFC